MTSTPPEDSSPRAEDEGPLDGLRVVDMTTFLSGPFCTQILGDLGAEVIKIEAPVGDSSRSIPPYFVGDDSAYYLSLNRNKESVVLDLKKPEQLAALRSLIASADVLIENYRPGVMDRLGLSIDGLREDFPDLVVASISGYGQTGPYRERPAYDMVVQAMSGVMSLTGEKGGRPVRFGAPIGDIAAGMYAAIGILAALARRTTTGRGDHVDVAMLDSQVSMLSYQSAYHLIGGANPGLQGRDHDSIPTYRGFACSDGTDVAVTANTEQMWRDLCRTLGLDALPTDERFLTNHLRFEHRHQLWPLLEAAFLTKSGGEWADALTAAHVPVSLVNSVADALVDPQVIARDMVIELDAGDGRQAKVVGNPIKFAESNRREQLYPPALGEHTESVLATLEQPQR